MSPELADRARHLHDLLTSCDSVLVAFSGGTDSAYLGWAATRALGARALLVTAESPSYPEHHRQLARRAARDFGFRHEVVRTGEFEHPEYRANPTNRCYFCKVELYSRLSALARERGISVVVDGNNADDRSDYRPGRRGGPRVWGAEPARRGGAPQARYPRAVAPRWPPNLGRAGVGVPLVEDPLRIGHHD